MSSAVVAEGHHSGPGSAGPNAMRTLLKFPDFIALGIALPIFIMADLPIVGWVVAAVTWFGSSALIIFMQMRAAQATEPRHQVGLVVGGSLARAWIAAAGILAAYLIGGDEAGLACALLMIGLFTIYFFNKMITHLISTPAPKA
ncbi:MAG: hypothetical protein JHD02_10460 [Thermoleophilaceae bacterium]|nr:hypothetical protein [Thermoleophilaceae bacterium]